MCTSGAIAVFVLCLLVMHVWAMAELIHDGCSYEVDCIFEAG